MILVNNNPIDDETIETELKRLMRVGSDNLPPDKLKKQIPAFRLQARDHAINRLLLLDEAINRNINVSDEEIDFFLAQKSSTSEAPRGKPRGIFAEPCEAQNAIPPCGKPQGFLAKKGKTDNIAGNHHGEQAPCNDTIREKIRDACRVEKLIKSIIVAVPDSTDNETLKYLKESDFIPSDKKHDPELMQKLIDKTKQLVKQLRQNQALTDLITELRNGAVIKESL